MTLLAVLTSVLSVLTPPVPAPTAPEAVASSASPGGAASQAGHALPVSSGPSRGLASWYTPRPSACWDGSGRHPLPPGLVAYTAARGLPCGTLVAVSGPSGSITVPVEDFGPEAWTGRVLDLSPAAFLAVAGGLGTGVIPVTWRAA